MGLHLTGHGLVLLLTLLAGYITNFFPFPSKGGGESSKVAGPGRRGGKPSVVIQGRRQAQNNGACPRFLIGQLAERTGGSGCSTHLLAAPLIRLLWEYSKAHAGGVRKNENDILL